MIYRKINESIRLKARCLSSIRNIGHQSLACENYISYSLGVPPAQYLQSLLQRCVRHQLIMEGKTSHGQVILYGLQDDTLTSNILINMYCKCGVLDYARRLFDEMPERSLVSWNTMIRAYTQHGHPEDALSLFVDMQKERTSFGEFTISSVLCACAAECAIDEGRQLHSFVIKTAADSNVVIGTALLDLYAKCNFVRDAYWIFESIEDKTAVTWSSMVAGFVRSDLYEEALTLYHRGQKIGLEQNQYTISSVLSACAELAALIQGNQVHAILLKVGIGNDVFVSSSLVDMYAKCGSIEEGYHVFVSQENKNVVLWNALMSGFSRHGRYVEVMVLFEKMQQLGFPPNEVTYVSVLSACAHMGRVDEGRKHFVLMKREQKVSPNVLHYSCLVDILGRAGMIQEAYEVIETMPYEATASMWGSFLASCRNYGKLDLAEIAARHLFEIEPFNAGNHILLSDIYAANKRWGQVAWSRKLLKESEARKERGKSWLEIKGNVHTFMVGERSHPQMNEIYLRLEGLMKEMKKLGYRSETHHDLHDVDEGKKEELLRHHSEKLALVLGIMCLPSGVPIRIMKNLRICGDCHSFMKQASKITKRVVIVRDVNRFHHFRDGFCSCGDFW